MRPLLAACLLIACLSVPASAGAIVGGGPPSRPYPHMAALYNGNDFFCGSSLVRANWVLTAAHCVEGEDATEYSIRIGSTDRSAGGTTAAVVEGFVAETGHDLALLRLDRNLSQAPIRVATPADASLYEPETQALAIGWGSTTFLGAPTQDLREVQVPIRDEFECTVAANVDLYDPETMVCAGETLGGEDTCQGDSGGPLMVPDATGALTLVGATSFGTGCGYPLLYGVYARTATAREWIDGVAGPAPDAAATAPGGGTPGGSGGGQPPAQSTPTQDARVELSLPAQVGSAPSARRSGRVRFPIRASGPVSDVRITLKRGRKLLGRASVGRIVGERQVRLRVRRSRVKPGRLGLRVTARDGRGRAVTAARRVKLAP